MARSGGVLGGAVEQNRGPQLPSLRLIPRSERCICTDSHPAPNAERRRIFRCRWYRDSHLRRPRERPRSSLRLLLPSPSAPACGPRFEKFRHTAAPDTPRLCSRLHRHRPILPDELLHTNGTQSCPAITTRTGNTPFTSHKPV